MWFTVSCARIISPQFASSRAKRYLERVHRRRGTLDLGTTLVADGVKTR